MRSLGYWLNRGFTDTDPATGDREAREAREGPPPPARQVLRLPDRTDDFWIINPVTSHARGPYATFGHADENCSPGEFIAARIVRE